MHCANNPVNFCDQTGEFIITTCVICCIAGVAIGATVGGIIGNVYAEKKGYVGWDKAKCIIAGAGIGGLAGGLLGYVAAPAVTALTGVEGIMVSSTGISVAHKVVSNIESLDAYKINHIINGSRGSDHLWENLSPSRSWDQIKPFIEKVLLNGEQEVYNNAFRKIYNIQGYDVEVRYNIVDNVIKIGDAFVRR